MPSRSPLLTFLKERRLPEPPCFDEWSLLFSEARSCGLLGSVAHELQARLPESTPPEFRHHVLAASIYSEGFRKDVWRELGHIEKALSSTKTRVLVLKGASYVLLGLPAANGRTFSDIDVLTPREDVASAEAALMLGGWSAGKQSPYDQRYYREWSHEIPPMTHLRRGTTIDLHHSLAMPTCRIQVDSAKMIAEAIPVAGSPFWWRLKDEDVLLHAASHLMLNSEFDHGLRDLWDIDRLFRHFTSQSDSYPLRLLTRAREVGLEAILLHALGLASRFFDTPIPQALVPNGHASMLSWILAQAASTRHPDTRPAAQRLADVILMIREVYLRLPTPLLAVHLWHKASTAFSPSERPAA